MNEKGLKPQFYKHLTYNQFRDVIPERKRAWDGNINSQLNSIKLYNHPEDYKDMLYSHAFPDTNLNYPKSRKSGNSFQHPSFDVPIPVITKAIPITGEQLLILNFEGADGATTWTEEAQGLSPTTNAGFSLDSALRIFGSSSLLFPGGSPTGNEMEYSLPAAITGDFTIHGWVCLTDIASYTNGYFDIIDVYDSRGIGYANMEIAIGTIGTRLNRWSGDSEGNSIVSDYVTSIFSEGIWHHVALIVNGRQIIYTIDGSIQTAWTATINAPFTGMDRVTLLNSGTAAGASIHYDAWELVDYAKWTKNFTPPKHAPVKGVVTV